MFWLAFALLGYVYLGYPLLAALRAAIRPRSHAKSSIEPMVSVIVAAYNEGDRIAARIENLLALDYPQDRLEIIIGSDGSTDDTVVRARRYEDGRVKVRPFVDRRGKPALLNRLVPARVARSWCSRTRGSGSSAGRSGRWWRTSPTRRSAP